MRARFTPILIFISLLCGNQSMAQTVANDECQFAKHIKSIDDYCSEPSEFTNVGATADPTHDNTCFLDFTNGVWFSFVPQQSAINVRLFGRGFNSNTLGNPQAALYSACGEYVTCSPGRTPGTDEFVVDNLLIGQVYYLMVSSAPGQEGTFQLCIDDFFAPPSPQSDCDKAIVLCDKSSFAINSLTGVGEDGNEVENNSCIGGESASSWYVWECEQSGTLTMELTPSNLGIEEIVDDLDFIIYELPNGVNDCTGKIEVRCMGSGANTTNGQIDPPNTWTACNRATGMRDGETDFIETGGCQDVSNNYIAPLDMVAGKAYGIIINNFSRSGLGFTLEWGGTGTFRGPDPALDVAAVQAFECDKTITFSQNSTSPDPIVSYTWNFGAGSTPSFSNDPNPQNVIYESFGNKLAALTIESERGCTVTEVIEFYVESCCADFDAIQAVADANDLTCFGDTDGLIRSAVISGGNPRYEYSLDAVNYQPNPQFPGLPAGPYRVFVRDIKGCQDTVDLIIDQPEELIVTTSPDVTIDLGSSTIFNATVEPSNRIIDSIAWSQPETLDDCTDCYNPSVTPLDNGSYTITVTDENGCTATASIRVAVNFDPDITAPNIFSPNGDFANQVFTLYGDKDIDAIEELHVYDRWGNQVYLGKELPISDDSMGWEGLFNGKPVEPGVYVWLGKVRFINSQVIDFTGDITVFR